MKLIVRSVGNVQVAPLVAAIALLIGIGLAVAGVYLLAGLGWSLVAGSVPMLVFSAVLIRGLLSAE